VPSAIIAGAGVFGASLAHRLTRAGWDVTIVDPYPPGHVRAASGHETRLIRFAHGTDRWYVRSARRARDLWRELEGETGRSLLVECGIAWFARRDDGWEAHSEEALRTEGVPVSRLTTDEAAAFFPSFDGEGLSFVLYEPEAGVLRARNAVRALIDVTLGAGARLVAGAARPEGNAVRVNGERLEADRIVWACGAWLPSLFPDLVRIRVTKQDVFHFGNDVSWGSPPVPAWVDYDAAVYGTGDVDGFGVKVAPDREGPPFDPDMDARSASPENERAARAYIATRFPELADAPLVGARTCPYALTPDTHFLIAGHPDHEQVWLLGGGSGHGFKHGPALAEYVLEILEGRTEPDPRFALGEREPAMSLRTAGDRSDL
jgi:glycine/D-amino acid oxidase-like deaminating enzyme